VAAEIEPEVVSWLRAFAAAAAGRLLAITEVREGGLTWRVLAREAGIATAAAVIGLALADWWRLAERMMMGIVTVVSYCLPWALPAVAKAWVLRQTK